MGEKSKYLDAVARAVKLNRKLRADDKRFNKGGVFLIHDDGSSFFWNSAFIQRWRGYVLVFTEHHNYHIYDGAEVAYVANVPRNKGYA